MRTLGRLGIDVYGLHRHDQAPALRSRYCRRGLIWDLDARPPAQSVDFLLNFAHRIGGRLILMPTNDETALFVAENGDRLKERYIFPDNRAELVRGLNNKRSMQFLAANAGIPTAHTVFPTCRDEVVEFARTAAFPVMLKGSDGIALSRRAGKKMVIVRDQRELLENYDRMEDASSPDLMLQEFIPGGDDSVWMFNGYFNGRSECRVAFTGKKIHQNPVYTGLTSLGICLPNETVEAQTIQFMRAIGYQGILDIGYRYDPRDGQYKVLDVNPRIGATFRLFVGDNGLDVARALYLDMTGQPVPATRLVPGRKWLVEDLDFISCLHYYRDGVLGFGEWLKGYRGVRETAWYAADDRRPFWKVLREFAKKPFRKTLKFAGLAQNRQAHERRAATEERSEYDGRQTAA